MTEFLEIAVITPARQALFHYHVPEEMRPVPGPGQLVVVPFGGQRVQGIVRRRVDSPEVPTTRPIEQVLDPAPVLTMTQMQLADWMADFYRLPLEGCLAAMLPPGLAKHAEARFELLDDSIPPGTPTALRLMRMLAERGPLRAGQIHHAFGRAPWERDAERLVRAGAIRRASILPPPSVRPLKVRRVRLAVEAAEFGRILAALRDPSLAATRKAAAERRARVLEALAAERQPMEAEWVYASSGAGLADLKWLAEEGWIDLSYEEKLRDSLAGKKFEPAAAHTLTGEQQAALDAILPVLPAGGAAPFLLYGATGSGKTEVYLRAAEAVIASGRRVIILVPEISLTPQTVRRFGERFPGRIGLVHSRLAPGERYDTWRRARAGLVDLVLGPRSALFAPLPDLGLIILDEEHDESYKAGSMPYFHARETAVEYGRLSGAVVLLGSATPDLTSYQAAQAGRFHLLRMPRRIPRPGGAPAELPPVEIVDMRQELRAGNRSMFSRSLADGLEACLKDGRQAILFLNRRGTASAVVCRACGAAVDCPRCELPLTAHADVLLCHRCGYKRGVPMECPQCRSTTIRPLGVGTKQVEEEVQKRFPGARTLRWDRDAVEEAGEHEILLEHFASHRADVLIGTQMVAKGLDIPQVTLVGMILADVGLRLPDYRSAERVFQVLMQVAGRAGRGVAGGGAVLQTYMPEHYALQLAARHDYEGFAAEELNQRRRLGYPPFFRLARLVYSHLDSDRACEEAEKMAIRVREKIAGARNRETEVIGPAPCYFEKRNGLYRWQILLRGQHPGEWVDVRLPDGWQADIDPVSLL